MLTMYILHGFIGSGKSTWARNFAKEHPDTKIVSADSFREMFNGEYKYLEELDDVISVSMRNTAYNLIANEYNVIIDCGNLSKERRNEWKGIYADKIAVIFPHKDKEWHLKNRQEKPHWNTDWDAVWESEHKSYEPINENEFDEVIYVEDWEGN